MTRKINAKTLHRLDIQGMDVVPEETLAPVACPLGTREGSTSSRSRFP